MAWKAELEEADSRLRIRPLESSSLEVRGGSCTAPAGTPGSNTGPHEGWTRWFLELAPRPDRLMWLCEARSECPRLCPEGCTWPG